MLILICKGLLIIKRKKKKKKGERVYAMNVLASKREQKKQYYQNVQMRDQGKGYGISGLSYR